MYRQLMSNLWIPFLLMPPRPAKVQFRIRVTLSTSRPYGSLDTPGVRSNYGMLKSLQIV